MKRTLLASLLALSFVPAVARADDGKIQEGDLVQGRRLFAIHCASCHGENGDGHGKVKTTPPAPALTDPAHMNLLSDHQVFVLLKKGGPALGKKATMPAFGDGLSDLALWDIVSYLRSRHLEVTDFYPNAASYYGEPYTIDQWGAQRYQKLIRHKLPKDERTYTVLGVYKGTQGPDGPRLIPNNPLAVSKIKRSDKVGYLVFVDGKIPGVRGSHLFGVSMDNSGLVTKIRVNSHDLRVKRRLEKMLASWEGYGHKDLHHPFTGRGRRERALAKAWTEIYDRAMEAVVMFDKAERERHWADEDFGGPKEPDASVKGGILKVNKHHHHHKRRHRRHRH